MLDSYIAPHWHDTSSGGGGSGTDGSAAAAVSPPSSLLPRSAPPPSLTALVEDPNTYARLTEGAHVTRQHALEHAALEGAEARHGGGGPAAGEAALLRHEAERELTLPGRVWFEALASAHARFGRLQARPPPRASALSAASWRPNRAPERWSGT